VSEIFVPRPWQPAMIDHIVEHPRCGVFAAMGSGKTGATLMALKGIEMLDEGPGLILAPKRVVRDIWPSEPRKWANIDVSVSPVLGDVHARKRALRRSAAFYAMNYEQLPWLVEHLDGKWPFRTIIADESTRLKGFRLRQGGQRTKALGKVAWLPEVSRFVELTGTPSPNGVKDLWGQLWYLDKGERLGRTFDAFTQRWFRPSWDGFSIEPFPHSQREIQERIADICITIDPRDYMSIDEPIERTVSVELPAKAREQYERMERTMYLELEGALEVEAVHAAARTNKCLQIASGFIYHEGGSGFTELHTAKLEALESIIEEAAGMPVLISYMFQQEFEMMRRHFPKLKHIDQVDTSPGGEWNRGRVPLMAAHPASAGHGLELQWGSNILVDFSSGWNLEYDDQIIERIGPMRQFQAGLNRPVYRYRIETVDTAEELVRMRRETKASVQQILLQAMKRYVSGPSADTPRTGASIG
jgi:SNF2 family DNA or RNA helicase